MCGVISVAWSIPVPPVVSCTQKWRSANLQYRKPTKKMWILALYTYPAWRLTIAETKANNSLQFFLEDLGRSIHFLWSVSRLLGAFFCFLHVIFEKFLQRLSSNVWKKPIIFHHVVLAPSFSLNIYLHLYEDSLHYAYGNQGRSKPCKKSKQFQRSCRFQLNIPSVNW